MSSLSKHEIVGLDIGQSAVKAVLLSCHGYSSTFKGGRVFEYRKEGVIGEDELSRELRPWLEQAGWHKCEITVGIPQYLATVQISDLASENGRKLDEMVEFETRQLAGLSDDNFLQDHQVMEPFSGRKSLVLIGFCRESVITEWAEKLAGANLRLADFTLTATALASAYVELYPEAKVVEEMHLLLDIGADTTTVAIVGNGTLLYASSLMCGVDRYVKNLAHELGVSEDDAAKQAGEAEDDSFIPDDVHARAAAVFDSELNSVISQWHSEEDALISEFPLTKVSLCGEGAGIGGLTSFLGEKLGCSAEVVGVPTDNGDRDPRLMTAYGLALHGAGLTECGISLAPPFVLSRALRRRRFPYLAVAATLLAILTVAGGMRNYFQQLESFQDLTEKTRELEESHSMVPKMEELTERIEALGKMLIPYAVRGDRVYKLSEAIEVLGAARDRVSLSRGTGEFVDAWVIYLADEKSFDAGKSDRNSRTDRARLENEDRSRSALVPFSSLPRESTRNEEDRFSDGKVKRVNEIEEWNNLVAGVYTVSQRGERYEYIRQFIEHLNHSDLFNEVDLMPGPEAEGREDIFMPWLQVAANQEVDFRRFFLRLSLRKRLYELDTEE